VVRVRQDEQLVERGTMIATRTGAVEVHIGCSRGTQPTVPSRWRADGRRVGRSMSGSFAGGLVLPVNHASAATGGDRIEFTTMEEAFNSSVRTAPADSSLGMRWTERWSIAT
jgi:hypothetical protein